MQELEVIERLRAGWELANRGTGWFLSAPRKSYQRIEQHQLPDEMIRRMELAGVIKTAMPYTTIRATLVEQTN